MISYKLKSDVIEHARWLVNNTNYGQRGNADGSKAQQFIGMVGQCSVMDMLSIELPTLSYEHDGGVDIKIGNVTIDVKTMGRTCDPKPYFVNNLIGLQKHFDVDAYIFCSINTISKMMSVCGWISKQDYFDKANLHLKGATRTRSDNTTFVTKADLYELPNSKLNQPTNVLDLYYEIRSLK